MEVASDPAEVLAIIRRALKDEGITQRQLAAHLGFTTKHMSQIMTGKQAVRVSLLFEILKFVGVAVAVIPQRQDEG